MFVVAWGLDVQALVIFDLLDGYCRGDETTAGVALVMSCSCDFIDLPECFRWWFHEIVQIPKLSLSDQTQVLHSFYFAFLMKRRSS